MQAKTVLLALTLMVGLVATSFAQDADKKMEKQLQRVAKNATGQLMKFYAPAKLTDEQKEAATAVIKKHAKKIMEARKAQDDLLTAEQKEARKEALAAAKKEGLKGNKMFKAGFDAMKLSEEEVKKFDEARKKMTEVMDGVKKAINEELTDEQKKAVMSKDKKGKGKGKKGKGKKKDSADGTTQTISVKLPGMTWGGCAANVRRSLTSVDGITEIETDIPSNSCTFKAPKDLDVKAMLDEFAEGGNRHIKGWSMK